MERTGHDFWAPARKLLQGPAAIFVLHAILLCVGQKVTIVSLNDVYKLVPLTSDLPYYYLEADLGYLDDVAAARCDGAACPEDPFLCGLGPSWEACFPGSFQRVLRALSLLNSNASQGVKVLDGPCGALQREKGSAEAVQYGGLVDFGATFRWLKDEARNRGDVAVGMFAGDFIAPSYLAEVFKGSQLIEIMNLMGVDLANIGNHDIDFKLPNLREQMRKSAFHYLNANLRENSSSEIQQSMSDSWQVEGDSGLYNVSAWRHLHQILGSLRQYSTLFTSNKAGHDLQKNSHVVSVEWL